MLTDCMREFVDNNIAGGTCIPSHLMASLKSEKPHGFITLAFYKGHIVMIFVNPLNAGHEVYIPI